MKTVKVKDKEFELFISSEEINKSVEKLAEKINREMEGKSPLFIGILNGTFIFSADLLKKITIPCEITFMRVSSYSGVKSTKNIKEIIGLKEDIKDRHVIILEDIVDTGLTLDFLLTKFTEYNPASIRVGTMFFKPSAFKKQFLIDYVGMNISNDFIVGYGLDYDGFGRNLPDVYKIKE
jgi:hypoxanthine phosphoribosyltransferase